MLQEVHEGVKKKMSQKDESDDGQHFCIGNISSHSSVSNKSVEDDKYSVVRVTWLLLALRITGIGAFGTYY